MSHVQQLIDGISDLNPMPRVASQILTLVEDPNASTASLAELVLFDPSVTATVLKTCNSAYFGLPRRVDSVHDAISLLGLDKIVDIVLLKSSVANLTRRQTGYGLHEGELWKQAVASALIAKALADKMDKACKHLVFTAALLKDIGKVILDRFVAGSIQKINDLVVNSGYSFREAEKRVIGVDHAELSGLVARKWQFSDKLVFIIANHHLANPSARQDEATAIVYLADTVCMMIGIGGGVDGLAYRFYDGVLTQMNIGDVDLQEIIADFGASMYQVEQLLQAV
ncbi:MAG: HDOD domain-containing protein [Desulfobacterales bacterium]